jgi:DNA polymerase-3 subunit beta
MPVAGASIENVEKTTMTTSTTASATMEIVLTQTELLKELTATQGVVERKTTIPILSNFLFEAAGDRLTITATDLDLSLRASCMTT